MNKKYYLLIFLFFSFSTSSLLSVKTIDIPCRKQAMGNHPVSTWLLEKCTTPRESFKHSEWTNIVAFSPDACHFASGSNKSAKIWNASGANTLKGIKMLVRSMKFNDDGTSLTTVSGNNGIIKTWDTQSGDPINTVQIPIDEASVVELSHDQKLIATALQQTVKIWNLQSKNCARQFQNSAPIISLGFSHDNAHLATGLWDGNIEVWNVQSGYQTHAFREHNGRVSSVTFSNNNKLLATGDLSIIKIWDLTTGENIGTLKGHTNWIGSIAFNHNDRLLATASYDKTIKLWDLEHGGNCINTLEGHTDEVYSSAFSADSHSLITGSKDGTIKKWDISKILTLKQSLCENLSLEQIRTLILLYENKDDESFRCPENLASYFDSLPDNIKYVLHDYRPLSMVDKLQSNILTGLAALFFYYLLQRL